MVDPALYEGREQTYIKHLVLKRYLQKLAYKIGWHGGTINYIDCFAGPWMHASEDLQDTSPFIAIEELRQARNTLQRKGRPALEIRCLFIEKNSKSYNLLSQKLQAVKELEVQVLHGEFEQHIKAIRSFAGRDRRPFTFSFIDPTGWTGYSLKTITPVLAQRGEVLINFMTQFVSRFIDDDKPEDIESFNRLFGSTEYRDRWKDLAGLDREDEIVRAYSDQIRTAGEFEFVANSVVLHPLKDRTHFHLIYATRHIEGLRVFRNDAERPAYEEQQKTRWQAQSRRRSEMSGQTELLFDQPVVPTYADKLRDRYQQIAQDRMTEILSRKRRILFEDLESQALLFPFMSTQRLKEWLLGQAEKGHLKFEGLGPRGRVPQANKGHWIVQH